MNNLKLGCAAVALSVFAGGALAGSYTPPPPVPAPAPAPAPTPWHGAFAGLHVGYAQGESTVTRPAGPPGPPGIAVTNDPEGLVAGGHVGYNFRSGNMVFGLIGDLSGMDVDDNNPDGPPGPPSVWETDYKWMVSLRGRIGMLASENALIYAHGGAAMAGIEHREIGGAGPWAGTVDSQAEGGYILGVGAEIMTGEKMSAFAEYSYMQFDDSSFTPAGPPGTISFNNDPVHMFKVGLSFHF